MGSRVKCCSWWNLAGFRDLKVRLALVKALNDFSAYFTGLASAINSRKRNRIGVSATGGHANVSCRIGTRSFARRGAILIFSTRGGVGRGYAGSGDSARQRRGAIPVGSTWLT